MMKRWWVYTMEFYVVSNTNEVKTLVCKINDTENKY